MCSGPRIFLFALVGVALATVSGAGNALAFGTYGGGCGDSSCHGDFRAGGSSSVHSMHVDFTNDCLDCHKSIGDDPETNSSGNYAEFSCNGCHRLEGLVRFHVSKGGSCTPCHSNDQPQINESTPPHYYQQSRSAITNACRVNTANGGEDYDGDGRGLDNDGDGLYDGDDPDCEGQVSTVEETWGTLKVLFDLD
jgi:hypothetical protein